MTPARLAPALSLLIVGAALPSTAEAGWRSSYLAEYGDSEPDVEVSAAGGDFSISLDTSASDWNLTRAYAGVWVWGSGCGYWSWGTDFYDSALAHEDTWSYSGSLDDIGATCGDWLGVEVYTVTELELDPHELLLEAFADSLPTEVDLTASRPSGHNWFWDFELSSTSDVLDGDADGWCVDTSRNLVDGSSHTAEVYSSLDPRAPLGDFVDNPENFDLVNYIINQDYRSQRCSADSRPFQVGDIQRAVWSLIDDDNTSDGLGTWSEACVDELLDDAEANGIGFLPTCGQEVAVLMAPVDETGTVTAQVVIAEIPLANAIPDHYQSYVSAYDDDSDWSTAVCSYLIDADAYWTWQASRYPECSYEVEYHQITDCG